MPEEIITTANILAGAGSGILVPFVTRLLGPAVDELGSIWSDRVRMYRLSRQIGLLDTAQKMLVEAGVEPKQVSLKTLLPLMENASVEDNPLLSHKWAALLANAADSRSSVEIKPVFSEILKQMSSNEAEMFDIMFKYPFEYLDKEWDGRPDHFSELKFRNQYHRNTPISLYEIESRLKEQKGGLLDDFYTNIDNMLRNRLLVIAEVEVTEREKARKKYAMYPDYKKPKVERVFFTSLAYDFMKACTPPTESV